jgi:hypothetical protein
MTDAICGHDTGRHEYHRPRRAGTSHDDGLADGEALLLAADHWVAAFGQPNIDRQRPVDRLAHEPGHFRRIADRDDRHVRQRAHDRDIVDREMGRAEWRINEAAAIADQPDRQIVQAKVDCNLLVAAAGDEGRDGVDVGNEPFHRQTGRHADHVGFGNALHVIAVGHIPLHAGQEIGAQIGADEHHPLVLFGEIVDHVLTGRAHPTIPSSPAPLGYGPARHRQTGSCDASWGHSRQTECPCPSPCGR